MRLSRWARFCFAAIVLTAAFAPLTTHAASQTRSPTACTTSGGAGNAWNNPGNAFSSNDVVTTTSVDGSTSEALECTNFGFALPAGVTITGIEVNIERRSSSTANGGSNDNSLLLLGGTLTGSNLADTVTDYTTTDFVASHGGPAETWGNTWSVAQINANAFGAALRVRKNAGAGAAHTISVDHVEITVHYSTPPPAPTLVSPADGASVAITTPTFDWTDVVDPDGDAVTYEMQADNTDCSFGSPEADVTGLIASTHSPVLAEGTYCWRARAVDALGVAGPWSTTRNVTIDLPGTSQTANPGNCVTGGGAGNAWNNPANAFTSDNADATVSVDGNTSEQLRCTNYGFSLPDDAVIVGIEVNVERSSSSTANGGSRDAELLLLGGTLTGSDLADITTTYGTTDAIAPHGSAAETWGNTWTPAQINSAAFGAALRVAKPAGAGGAHTVSVDHLSITVHYVRPPVLQSAGIVCGANTQVEVLFSVPLSAATAQNPANYTLNGGASVIAAVLGADNRVVTLTTSALSNFLYTLTVNNVEGSDGGTITANSQATFSSEGGYLSGLQGSYFANMTLSGAPAGERIDGPVDFDWGNGTPGVAGIGADNFSVRWTGFVTPTLSGNYTFRTRSDDGVRLYIDGNLVIDNWTDHAATDNDSAAIALTAGQRHAVTMEYYENGGGAVAQLSWSGPGTGGFQFVPRSSLSHFCGAPAPRAFFQLDEASWNAAGDVVDATGNGFSGTAVGGTTPVPAQVCNGAQLDGTGRHITVPGLSGLLNATASLAFWIRTTQTGNDLGWQAPGVSGVELSGGADDIFWGWLDAGGRIGVSVGNDYGTKSATAINNGVWRHVVLTRDHNAGTYKIYIDGALDAQGAIAGGVIGTAFSSLGRIEDTGGSPVYLDGQLDEIRIYDQVLSDAQVLTIRDITRPCISLLDHIRIEHNGLGLTCEPATVTVRACADATCSTPYTGSVTTTLSPTGWVGGDTINFTSPSGSTTAQLRRTTAGVVVLGAGTTAPAPANPTQCYNGLTATCSFEFRDTGFLFSAIPAQVAGTTSATHTLQAVRTDNSTGACTALFTGAVPNIELASECVNPATCQPGQQVTFNNNGSGAIAANDGGAVSSWTTRTLVFGAGSTANFTFSYPDVGAMRLHARYNIDGSGNYMTGSTPGPYFVVKPAGFTVTGIERTADGFANPGAADAAGAVFIKAGEPMTLTVTAVNSSGQKTPNYGKETPAQGVQLTAALVGGLGLTASPVLGNSTIPGSAFGNGANAGIATVNDVTWDEVGIITITPSVGGSDYLGAGDVTGTASGNIGRFTPHHFDVSPGAPMLATACIAGGHTYTGQVFGFAAGLVPELAVTARASGGALTANYKGTFFKITNGGLAQAPYATQAGRYARFDALGGGNTPALDVSGLPATATDPAITDNNNGTATLTFSGGSGLAFVRASPAAPFDADISLAINVVDTDDVAYASNPARFGADAAGAGIAFSGGKEMRFGRLRLGAASGSQLLPLQLPLEAQYWGGTFWLTNVDDSCTTLSPANIGLGNPVGNLALGETAASAVTSPLSAGRGTVTLSAPGAGNNGSVDVAVNLGSGPNAVACPAFAPVAAGANRPYLHGQWCGATATRDPSARARFGIRGGSSETIYRRESFN